MKNADEYLLSLINEWLKEKTFNGTKLNQKNLDRLNKSNIIIAKLFGDKTEKIQFEEPTDNQEFCMTYVYIDELNIDKNKDKLLFIELLSTVDCFYINPIHSTLIQVAFGVDNIWS